jgi:hypothetical protein
VRQVCWGEKAGQALESRPKASGRKEPTRLKPEALAKGCAAVLRWRVRLQAFAGASGFKPSLARQASIGLVRWFLPIA